MVTRKRRPKQKAGNPKASSVKPPSRGDPKSALKGKPEPPAKKVFKKRDALERIVQERTEELRTHQIELEMQNEELRSAQQDLEASRRKYLELYEFAPVGYFTFDMKGRILEVNVAGSNQLEIDKQELLKKPFTLFIPSPDDRLYFTAHNKRTFLTRQRQECDLKLRRRDGAVFYARLDSIAIENIDGSAGYIRTAVTDITRLKLAEDVLKNTNEALEKHVQVRTNELATMITALTGEISDRKRAEKTLGETQENLKKAQALAHIGSWSFDLRSGQLTWSEELFRIFGVAPGTSDSDLKNIMGRSVHADDRQKMRKAYRQMVKWSKAQP